MATPPFTLLWTEALHWMVYGEVGKFSDVKLTIEKCYAELNGELPPKLRMEPEAARQALRDRLESGEAVATGRRCWAPAAGALISDSLPSDIPASAWPAFVRIDDEPSFAEVEASIPGQGYRDIRVKRPDVLAAFEAAMADASEEAAMAEQAPPEPAPEPCIKPKAHDRITRLIAQARADDRPVLSCDKAWKQFHAEGGGMGRAQFRKLYLQMVAESGVNRPKRGRLAVYKL